MTRLTFLSLLLALASPALADEPGAGEICPADANRRSHKDHCAHQGQPLRDRDGRPCPGGHRSPVDGIHTSEVRMGTLTECFGKPSDGEDYLLCVAKYVEAYYRVCPHYKGLF